MKTVVVGAGYVGLVAAVCLANDGHSVICVERDERKLQMLRARRCPIFEQGLDVALDAACESGHLRFRPDLLPLDGTDVVMVAVGTPTITSGAADLAQVTEVVNLMAGTGTSCVLAMKSTVPPGTGRRLAKRLLDLSNVSYASNPEFLREGKALEDWRNPSRIVVGSEDRKAAETVAALYQNIDAPVILTDTTSAELIKYASNAFLATKISFINEIACVCDAAGADIDDVARGIGMDPRIGKDFLQAGLGYGGSCFPKDTKALDYSALANGYDFRLLKSTIEVNTRQRMLAVQRLSQMLGGLDDKVIACLGLAFKPGTDDVRESSAVAVVNLLYEKGARIQVHDPMALANPALCLPQGVTLCDDMYDTVSDANAVALLTEWPEYLTADWRRIKESMKPPYAFFDGRNALEPVGLRDLGFEYRGIGRAEPCPPS